MSDFKTATTTSVVTDLTKRVRYATGLVLGVDEFEQEQAYLLEQDRLHARTLHGYGVVHGLGVSVADTADGPEVRVEPGLAVAPTGHTICVDRLQCGPLASWLARQSADDVSVTKEGVSVTLEEGEVGTAVVSVVLCHRDCETDEVPIPGSPCRSASDSAVPSRLKDDFELVLSPEPPTHDAEKAARAFGGFLDRITVTEHDAPDVLDLDALLGAVDAWIYDTFGGPEALSDATDPAEGGPLRIPAIESDAMLRAVFGRWAEAGYTQLFDADASQCSPFAEADRPPDTCVLLAQLRLCVTPDGDGLRLAFENEDCDVGAPEVSVEQRPVLLSTRVLQEWLMQGTLSSEPRRRTLATMFFPRDAADAGVSVVGLWMHAPVDAPGTDAFAVEVNGTPVDVDSVSDQSVGGERVVYLNLDVSAPEELAIPLMRPEVERSDTSAADDITAVPIDEAPGEIAMPIGPGPNAPGVIGPGMVVTVRIDLSAVTQTVDGETVSVLDLLDAKDAPDLLDRNGETALVYGVVPRRRLGDLDDVQVTGDGAPADGGDLIWDASSETWVGAGAPSMHEGDAAGGDLAGTYPDPTVAGLQGTPVSDASPSAGQALLFQDGTWTPGAVSAEAGVDLPEIAATLPTLPFATITPVCLEALLEMEDTDTVDRLEEAQTLFSQLGFDVEVFRVWLHFNAGETLSQDNVWETNFDFETTVFAERNTEMSGSPFLTRLTEIEQAPLDRNVMLVAVRKDRVQSLPYLRFRFDLDGIIIENTEGQSLTALEWVQERPVKWEGHDGASHVTVFAEVPAACAPRVEDLRNVTGDAAPEDGQVLVYDASAETWTFETPSTGDGGATTLDGLTDVNAAGADVNFAIVFDGSQWQARALLLDDLSGVSVSAPGEGDVLQFQNGTWQPGQVASGVTQLTGLSDVRLQNLTVNDVLTYNGTEWVADAVDVPSGPNTLKELDDVEYTREPEAGDALVYDGEFWRLQTGGSGQFVGRASGPYSVVAAGLVGSQGSVLQSYNNLTCDFDGKSYLLQFKDFKADVPYVVTATRDAAAGGSGPPGGLTYEIMTDGIGLTFFSFAGQGEFAPDAVGFCVEISTFTPDG